MCTVVEAFPSKAQDDSPPLPVWDTLNYLLHGRLKFNAEMISTVIELHNGEVELLQLTLVAERMKVIFTNKSTDFEGHRYLAAFTYLCALAKVPSPPPFSSCTPPNTNIYNIYTIYV